MDLRHIPVACRKIERDYEQTRADLWNANFRASQNRDPELAEWVEGNRRLCQSKYDELRRLLAELDEAVSIRLPETAATLRVVGTPEPAVGEALVQELRSIRAAATRAVADQDQPVEPERDKQPDQEQAVVTIPAEPKTYLTSWLQILDAVGRKNNKTERSTVTKLNKDHEGPIKFSGRGKQPFVDQAELLVWWNSLANRFRELQDRHRDRQATVADQHGYGATGTVVPGISGSVKERRRDAKR